MDSTSFTFLATILILVLLSAALVLRSYIVRRRYRQHVQQALTSGVFIDNNAFNDAGGLDSLAGFRRSTRRPGPKPVLWDIWTQPLDKDLTSSWTSVIPVAVHCASSLPPSSLMSFSQSSTGPLTPPSSFRLQSRPRPSFLSQIRLPSSFSLSPRSSSSLAGQAGSPNGSYSHSGSRSPPQTTPRSPDARAPINTDAATLAVCVLIAMPDISSPVHHPAPDAKGKAMDPQPSATRTSDDAGLLSPSLHQSRVHIPNFAVGEGLPVLELGVVEVKTGEWLWRICET